MKLSHPPTVLPINDSLYHGSIQPTSPLRRLYIIPKTPTRSQSATTSEHPIEPIQRTYRQLYPSASLPRSLPSIPVSNLQRRHIPAQTDDEEEEEEDKGDGVGSEKHVDGDENQDDPDVMVMIRWMDDNE